MEIRQPASGRDREEHEEAYRLLRGRAAKVWGEARASAIEAALRRTSDALWKLDHLEFENDDRPGFFLADLQQTAWRGSSP
ncbi:MAG: hypothetical protein HYY34_03895 [Chloroflexi bacterium]|nr:hypothetical protein [Chloroflexota bacterium]